MIRRAALVVLLVFVAGVGGAGCVTTTIIPPPPSGDDVPVFITDYSRHSSILLPDPAGHYNEYAFGDFNWFALSKTKGSDAARAMLWSAGATMGRRQLKLTDNVAAVTAKVQAEKVIRIEAPRAKVNALIAELDAAYFARYDTITYNPASSMWFVRSREPYNALHNCNHLTACWLRQLGCKVRGAAIFSKFRISPAR
ncbi:MAG: hypothetical protein QOF78_379 [Phycisphaerales bacterium]|jgi:hypothetical protein|nr:hypothetical protein [Phycisphaerales bacterium]